MVSATIRNYQGAPLDRFLRNHRLSPASAARQINVPVEDVAHLRSGYRLLTPWWIAVLATITDASDADIRDIVDGAALMEWYRNPRGRRHPFVRCV